MPVENYTYPLYFFALCVAYAYLHRWLFPRQESEELTSLQVRLDAAEAKVREIIPEYQKELASRDEEIARIKYSYMAECSDRLHREFVGHLRHLGVKPHCDWDGHPTAQVLGTEYNAVYYRLQGVLKLLEEVYRRYQFADVGKTDNNYDSRYVDLSDLEDRIKQQIKDVENLHAR